MEFQICYRVAGSMIQGERTLDLTAGQPPMMTLLLSASLQLNVKDRFEIDLIFF